MTQTDRLNGLLGNVAIKAPVRVAATGNLTLSGFQTIDGIAMADGDANLRVLAHLQTNAAERGIYDMQSGAWVRSADFDGARDVVTGTLIPITEGTTYGTKLARLATTGDITIGTTSLSFTMHTAGLSGAISAFVEALLDDASASAFLDTLGFSALGKTLAAVANAAAARSAVGGAAAGANVDITSLGALGHPINKNFIINGNFDVWQEGTSFAAAASGQHFADVFSYVKGGTSAVHTLSQATKVADAANVPTQAQSGVISNYSALVDCTTADAAVGASDNLYLAHYVEGYGLQYLEGQTITLSFWVQATKTGTYCVAFRNSAADRSYVAEYTVSTANTWEKKTVTLTLNYSGGTWNYTNGIGLQVIWALMAGTNSQTTAGAWQSGNYIATASQVNACDNTANNFYLAQVQLEIGSVATRFEVLSYTEVLRRVQRYLRVEPALNSYETFAAGHCTSATAAEYHITFPVEMRTTPSFSKTGTFQCWSGASAWGGTSLAASVISRMHVDLIDTHNTGSTAGNACILRAANDLTASLIFDARLA